MQACCCCAMSLNDGPAKPLLGPQSVHDKRSKAHELKPVYQDIKGAVMSDHQEEGEQHVMLGTFRATAICGNDITGSCLYTAGLCVATAGPMGPVCLLVVGVILYAFRSIYGEVVTAMPVNGGSYNALLNTTSKPIAALAACLSMLSYIATCVVSATSAVTYAQNLWAELPLEGPTVGVLGLFALLCAWGLKDSANVAAAMFFLHITTMSILVVAGVVYVIRDGGSLLRENWDHGYPPIMDGNIVRYSGSLFHALFFGVARGLLGITGFETSSNFVEEQLPGVFQRTLYWMWLAVTFFNPVLAFLSLGLCTPTELNTHQNDLLAFMGGRAIGHWFRTFTAVDATIVLAGSVLTSYVGVTGLMRRMSMDRCLPQLFLQTNKWRGTNHWIIFTFFAISSSLFLVLRGNLQTLSGVYTMAFLSVMMLFAIGCILLKQKRADLKRDVRAGPFHLIAGMVLVAWGLLGNTLISPTVLEFFVLYFACVLMVVAIMFQRARVLRVLAKITPKSFTWCRRLIAKNLVDVKNDTLVFFCKSPDLFVMNKAMLYIRDNEQTAHVAMVHIQSSGENEAVMNAFKRNVVLLNHLYPKYVIDMIGIRGSFGPEMIDWVCKYFNINHNMIFIACPSSKFEHQFADLGGVRVVTHHLETSIGGEGDLEQPGTPGSTPTTFDGFGPLPPTERIELVNGTRLPVETVEDYDVPSPVFNPPRRDVDFMPPVRGSSKIRLEIDNALEPRRGDSFYQPNDQRSVASSKK